MRSMTKDGKDLQRLIRVIESARAAGKEIAIESPKYFTDRITGKRREHDVVLTIKHAHHELVVALECRDRSRKVGVPEVEAFHTKCRDTGIHSGIIVSSRGFWESARTKAKAYRIRCFTLDEVAKFDWFGPEDMLVVSRELKRLYLQVDFGRPFSPNIGDLLNREGHPITSDMITSAAKAALERHQTVVPTGVGEHTVGFNVSPEVSASIDQKIQHAKSATLFVTFENTVKSVPFVFRSYNDESCSETITQAAVANVRIGDQTVDFVASTDKDGFINIAIIPTSSHIVAPAQ